MFTGIIEEIGTIQSVTELSSTRKFIINAAKVLDEAKIGDSISVNGCCLTITDLPNHAFACTAVEETLQKTNLGDLAPGLSVNLERALKLGSRLDGHLVQGHIDGVGIIISKKLISKDSWLITIKAPPSVLRYLIMKGSICIDGISLTIAALEEDSFSLAIIPHTAHHTTLTSKEIGDKVNIEVDMMSKYIEKFFLSNNKQHV